MAEKAPDRLEVLQTVDALSRAVDILAPQLGTDQIDLSDFVINVMRFTNLNNLEILPIMYFRGHENEWIKERMTDYMNLKMSHEKDPRYRVVVDALKAIGGKIEPKKKKKDDRGFIGKHFTKRGQGPEDEE